MAFPRLGAPGRTRRRMARPMTDWQRAPTGSEMSGRKPDAAVCSPDGSVQIVASLGGMITIHVQGLHRHSDESLARQVRAAARLALASLRRSAEMAEPPAADRRSGP